MEVDANMSRTAPPGSSPAFSGEKDKSSDGENAQVELDTSPSRLDKSIPTWKWALVCLGLAIGAFLYGEMPFGISLCYYYKVLIVIITGLDTTISADVQGPILKSLGEINKLAWVGIGFPMGSVAVILLIGHCYDLFQVKYMYICSVVVFEVGSAVCGAAPSMNAMIVGRIIAGIGGAGIYLGYVSTHAHQSMGVLT
jgi:MFS family permease